MTRWRAAPPTSLQADVPISSLFAMRAARKGERLCVQSRLAKDANFRYVQSRLKCHSNEISSPNE